MSLPDAHHYTPTSTGVYKLDYAYTQLSSFIISLFNCTYSKTPCTHLAHLCPREEPLLESSFHRQLSSRKILPIKASVPRHSPYCGMQTLRR